MSTGSVGFGKIFILILETWHYIPHKQKEAPKEFKLHLRKLTCLVDLPTFRHPPVIAGFHVQMLIPDKACGPLPTYLELFSWESKGAPPYATPPQ